MSEMCIHGTPLDVTCFLCEEGGDWELDETDRENVEILLEHAILTGKERDDLQDLLDYDDLDVNDKERLQELVNSHISIIHAHQK